MCLDIPYCNTKIKRTTEFDVGMYIFLKNSAVSFLIKHVCVTIILKGAKSSSGTSLNFIFFKEHFHPSFSSFHWLCMMLVHQITPFHKADENLQYLRVLGVLKYTYMYSILYIITTNWVVAVRWLQSSGNISLNDSISRLFENSLLQWYIIDNKIYVVGILPPPEHTSKQPSLLLTYSQLFLCWILWRNINIHLHFI